MVRVSKVSGVQEMNIPHISHLVVVSREKLAEVLCGFKEVREPNQVGEIGLFTLNHLPSQLDLVSFLLISCL